MKALLFIPTYNEINNVPKLCSELLSLNLPVDILFIDDNSPDGTGVLLDDIAKENTSVNVLHRSCKQGIGSAHLLGIKYAYDKGYSVLLSMDADFTHRPEYIKRLLCRKDKADIIVASRHLKNNGLNKWNLLRRVLTRTGHFLLSFLLRMDYDATGALRLYRIDKIPREVFDLVYSSGYSFFFESLFILLKNGCQVYEFPIKPPARSYGSSKMNVNEVKASATLLVKVFFQSIISPSKFKISKA